MATTVLTLRSNRWRDMSVLSATVASVAVDTQIAENFTLPTGFGDLFIDRVVIGVSSLSADLVDPSYPSMQNGISVEIIVNTTAALGDVFMIEPLIARGGTEARPLMQAGYSSPRLVLIRQDEYFQIVGPILAGAGATATIGCTVRGIRLRQA